MSVVISQPMLFPWVGMLEQVRLADLYVHYQDVQFSKGGFVNRVQVKTAQGPRWLTVPLKNLHLGQNINEVQINDDVDWRRSHIEILRSAYSAAPYYADMIALVESVYQVTHGNIGSLSESSLMAICEFFGLSRQRRFLSSDRLEARGTSSRRVLDMVLELKDQTYITGHGARSYLDHNLFEKAGVRVEYMNYTKMPYRQLHGAFTPYVSALDLIANCGREGIAHICSTSVYWKDFLDER